MGAPPRPDNDDNDDNEDAMRLTFSLDLLLFRPA